MLAPQDLIEPDQSPSTSGTRGAGAESISIPDDSTSSLLPRPRFTGDPLSLTSLGYDYRKEAALTYALGCFSGFFLLLFWPIPFSDYVVGVFFLIAEQRNDYVRFHAWQSCLTFLVTLVGF